MGPFDLATAGLTGVASMVGGFLNNEAASARQQDAQNFNAQQSYVQDAFQERMRNTAYQAAVGDMKAAGLNPMMMYGSGSAAASPSGSMATSQAAPTHDVVTPAVSSALSSLRLSNEIETAGLSRDNLVAQGDNIRANTRESISRGNRTDAETLKTMAETPGAEAQSRIMRERIEAAINEALQAKNERPYLTSKIAGVLSPTARGMQELYKVIPPVKFNVNSARSQRSQSGWIGGNEVDTQSFENRFNASAGLR